MRRRCAAHITILITCEMYASARREVTFSTDRDIQENYPRVAKAYSLKISYNEQITLNLCFFYH